MELERIIGQKQLLIDSKDKQLRIAGQGNENECLQADLPIVG